MPESGMDGSDLQAYLQHSPSLNDDFKSSQPLDVKTLAQKTQDDDWFKFNLSLKARDFFVFGSGQILPKQKKAKDREEDQIIWTSQSPKIEEILSVDSQFEEQYVIPATSIKGTLSHRLAFHFNALTNQYLEQYLVETTSSWPEEKNKLKAEIQNRLNRLGNFFLESSSDDMRKYWEDQLKNVSLEAFDSSSQLVLQLEAEDVKGFEQGLPIGEDNHAVKSVFGYARDTKGLKSEAGARGKMILSDIYLDPDKVTVKSFTHVAIDRFTGGAKDAALFEEEVISYPDTIETDIWVHHDIMKDD
ncbi:MAG: RAMP superfamily CRISPR-associated protein, partial [Bacteroidota bacterium]